MKIHNDIDKFIGAKPAQYPFLKTISFSRSVDCRGATAYEIEIVLTKIFGCRTEDLKAKFSNAVDIKIGEVESMFGMLLDIEDVIGNQIEGVAYRVSELENNTFSFACSDFFVEVMD